MLLNDIKRELAMIDPLVFYGLVPNSYVDENGKKQTIDIWDYTVFNRVKLKNSANKTSYVDAFEVHIVREEYIPEGIDVDVIEKLTALPGVKLGAEDGVYDYTMKPGTNTVVEMLTLTFTRSRK